MNKNQALAYYEKTGLYPSRYWARKLMSGDNAIVKVCGGYKLMDWNYYYIFKKQK